MRESYLERRVCMYIKNLGGMAIKLDSLSALGLPDRLCVLPNGQILFVELKSPNGKGRLSATQKRMLEKLTNLGHRAICIKSLEELKKEVENGKGRSGV